MTEQSTDYDSPWKEVKIIRNYYPTTEVACSKIMMLRAFVSPLINQIALYPSITNYELRISNYLLIREVSSSIVEVIYKIEEPSVLKMLHKSAIAIPSTAEFQQVLDIIASDK